MALASVLMAGMFAGTGVASITDNHDNSEIENTVGNHKAAHESHKENEHVKETVPMERV